MGTQTPRITPRDVFLLTIAPIALRMSNDWPIIDDRQTDRHDLELAFSFLMKENTYNLLPFDVL